FLLEREQLLVVPRLELGVRLTLARRARAATGRRVQRLHRGQQAEQRRLPAASIALLGRAALARGIERRAQPRAGMAARPAVERAALDQLLDHGGVALLRVDPPAQLEQRVELAVARARLEDRLDRGAADALDRAQAEANDLAVLAALPGGDSEIL